MLFLNLRGEVTEGAISNIFIEKDGRWFTPPIECGLLPGVYRRHLLETRPEIEERVLFEEDLRHADAIYLANAVRGLRRVEIELVRESRNVVFLVPRSLGPSVPVSSLRPHHHLDRLARLQQFHRLLELARA